MSAHVNGCPHCHELFEHAALLGRSLANAASGEPGDLSGQLARAEAVIRDERGPRAYLRSRSTRVRWLLLLCWPALLLLLELVRQRVPWSTLTSSRLSVGVLLLASLVLVTQSALRPQPIERRAATLRSALAMVAWCLPCVLWFVPETQASSDELSGPFALRSFACFAYGSALAAPAFGLLWALDRGAELSFRVLAFAAGVVALVANLILILHCPATNRAHLVAGHFSIGLAWFLAVSLGEWWRRRA